MPELRTVSSLWGALIWPVMAIPMHAVETKVQYCIVLYWYSLISCLLRCNMLTWVLHSGQYWWNSTFSVTLWFQQGQDLVSLLAWDMDHMPLMKMKISIALQAHSSTWGKGTKNFLAIDYSRKLYKLFTSLWKCWVGFLLSTIKPQVIRLELVLYCKGKKSLTPSTDLLNQWESYFLAVYTSVFHPRNERYVFHYLLHFQDKFCFASHQNKSGITPVKTMKQFQIYQDAMKSRFWSSGFIIETNEATDSVFIIERKTAV